jgi:hypothetical protein
MQPAKLNYKIYEGSTFQETFRWESQTKSYAQISAISKAAPCVITTSSVHSCPVNWRVRVTGVGGMKEINTVGDDQYYLVTAKTSNTVTLNQINSANYTTYTSGGILEWNTPIDLTGYTAQMQIRETLDSTNFIHELTSASGGGISIDTTDYTITINIPANVTRNFDFATAVYSLELTNSSGAVTTFVTGNLTLVKEITR